MRFFLIILMQPVCLTRNRMTSHCVSSFTESTQFVTHSDSVRRQRNWRKKRSRQTFTHVTDSGANDGDGGVGEELAGAGIHRQIVREKGTGKVTALRPSSPLLFSSSCWCVRAVCVEVSKPRHAAPTGLVHVSTCLDMDGQQNYFLPVWGKGMGGEVN